MIRVYNTLSKSKEPFETVRPGKVGIYLCGPTVYKPSHIGHMVGPVIFDAIKRYLVYSGYDVTLVINITDVDDKLIAESNKRGVTMPQIATEMTRDYMQNLQTMEIDSVNFFPKATEHIDHIIEFTANLIEKGYAYVSEGDVYFDVGKDHDYGKLSHRTLESMIGEGGDTAERKRSTADFALWKSAKPGEPSWPSPWGPGRPGWHIECSVMSSRILGETFDIHGGGLDLVFPHHENEIAQSECRFGKPMARYWLHNGLMQASDEVGKVGGRQTRAAEGDLQSQSVGKISKSKGASAFRDLLQQFAPENIRFFLLSSHYRRPIDYSEERIREVGTGMEAFYRFFKRYQRVTGESFYDLKAAARRDQGEFDPQGDTLLQEAAERRKRFLDAMDDDFNTGGAIAELFELMRRLNKFVEDEKLEAPAKRDLAKLAALRQGATTFREMALTLGLFRTPPPEKTAGGDNEMVGKLMQLLIEVRAEARKTKNFAMADQIRKRLSEMGITLEDRPGGTDWTLG
jgi:cysteinyl-tRNA synthetase